MTTTIASTLNPPYLMSPAPVAGPMSAGSRTRPAVRSKLASAVLVVATVFGLLFGLTAPSVSPVTPPAPPSAVAATPVP